MIRISSRGVALKLQRSVYSRAALEAGALVLGRKADVFLGTGKKFFEVEIRSRSRASKKELQAMAGGLLNEALSHQYRQKVIRFNRGFSQGPLSRLLSQGFQAMPPDPLEQLEPQVRIDRERETADLLAKARTMS